MRVRGVGREAVASDPVQQKEGDASGIELVTARVQCRVAEGIKSLLPGKTRPATVRDAERAELEGPTRAVPCEEFKISVTKVTVGVSRGGFPRKLSAKGMEESASEHAVL